MGEMLTADEVAGIMKLSRRSAYRIMREMPHMERPLRVTSHALSEWVDRRTVYPQEGRRARTTDTRHRIERKRD